MKIVVNNRTLDLNDHSIRYEKINDIFNLAEIESDYTFPFTGSLTENNKIALGFVNHPDTLKKKFKLPCYVELKNLFSFRSTLIITGYTESVIHFSIAGGVTTLELADTPIHDILPESIHLGDDQSEVVAKVKEINETLDPEEYGFCFPPIGFTPVASGGSSVANEVNPTTNTVLYNTSGTGNLYTLIPQFHLFYVLKQIADAEKIALIGEFIDDSEQQELLLSNAYAIDKPAPDNSTLIKKPSSQTFGNSDWVAFRDDVFDAYDNAGAFNNGTFEYVFPETGVYVIEGEIYRNMLQPAVDVFFEIYYNGSLYGFEEISLFNSSLFFSRTITIGAGDVGKVLKFKINVPPFYAGSPVIELKSKSFVYIENTSLTGLNLFDTDIYPKNHITNWTVSELLLKIKKQFNLKYTINKDEGYIQIDYANKRFDPEESEDITSICSPEHETIIENSEINYKISFDASEEDFKDYNENLIIGSFKNASDLPTPKRNGDLALVMAANKIYVSYNNGSGLVWKEHTNAWKYYETGKTNIEDITLDFLPITMIYSNNSGEPALIPFLHGAASSPMFGAGIVDHECRLFYRRGMNVLVGAADGGKYLFASSGVYGLNGNRTGNYNLTILDERGLKNKFFSKSIPALQDQEITERNIYLDEARLINFSMNSKKIIQGTPYLVKSISVPVGTDIGFGLIRLLKI